jgi:BMFP domain-containing protein YqiC
LSRIVQLQEQARMRADLDALKARVAELEAAAKGAEMQTLYDAADIQRRLEALEAKRKPGRPPKQ